MNAILIAAVIVPVCSFYLYALRQFWREGVQLRSGRSRDVALPTCADDMKFIPMETPALGPLSVIPINQSKNYVAEGIERRRAS